MPDDQAQQILAPAQIDNGLKADAWEAFNGSANERELGSKLQNMNLPQKVKADLWEAKRGMSQSAPNLVTGQGMEQAAQQQASGYLGKALAGATAPYEQQQAELQKRKNMAMRWQNNNPTPVTNATALYAPVAAARGILGAKVGGKVGSYLGPYGQLAGGIIGGGVAAGIPESNPLQPTVNPSTGAATLPEIPSSIMDIPKTIIKKMVENKPVGAGNLSMNEREALELQAQALMRRGVQQGVLDSKAAIAARLAAKNAPQPSPFEGMTSTAGGAAPVAAAPTMPQGNPTPFVGLSPAPETASQDLISRMKKLVIPGEEITAADLKRAGDLTQAPLAKIKALAKFGDKLAQNELNRRLKQ